MDSAPVVPASNDAEDAITLKLRLSDFIRYATGKKLRSDCPGCGLPEPGWIVYANRRGNMVIPHGIDENIFMGGGVATIAMRCTNCGFVRQFDLAHVTKWLEENKE